MIRKAPGAVSIMCVRTIPGWTALAVTRVPASRDASSSVNISMKSFVAE